MNHSRFFSLHEMPKKKILSYLLPAAFSLKAAARAKVNFQEKPKKLRSGKRTNGEGAARRIFCDNLCAILRYIPSPR